MTTNSPICIRAEEDRVGVYRWAVEHFGRPASWLATTGWRYNAGEYFFYNEQDAAFFLLRWKGEIIQNDYAY